MTPRTEFGFLKQPVAVSIPNLRIWPLGDHEERAAGVASVLHEDGYYYPPVIHRVRLPGWPDDPREETIPKTRRPAQLFALPSSHVIELDDPVSADPLGQDVSFVVQVLALLYGTRLQPSGWHLDGRVPIDYPSIHVWVGQPALERILARAVQEWRAQPEDRRLRLTNILYMHAKVPSYEWPWEQFFIQYLVLDALYDYCCRTGTAVAVAHADRIKELCERHGVWCAAEAPVSAIVQMRNDLFHEVLWEGERPGYRISAEAFDRTQELRELSHRLILAVLAGSTPFTRSPWTEWRTKKEVT